MTAYTDLYKKSVARSEGIPLSLADRSKIDTATLAKAAKIELSGSIVWTHKPAIDADGEPVLSKKGHPIVSVLTWVPLIVELPGKGPRAMVWVTKSRKMAGLEPADPADHTGATAIWETVSDPMDGAVVLDMDDVRYADGKTYPQAYLRPADIDEADDRTRSSAFRSKPFSFISAPVFDGYL